MTNRTDYRDLATELQEQFGFDYAARERIETELHNAHVAGQEGGSCACGSCMCNPAAQEDQSFERLIRQKQDEILACTQRLFDKRQTQGVDSSLDHLEKLAFELVKLEDARIIARMQHRRVPTTMKMIVDDDKEEARRPEDDDG